MPLRLPILLSSLLLMVSAAEAGPRVVADIAPVHALAARVMVGAGEPALAAPPGASPHAFSLRPSQAAALEGADLLVWVGPRLAPWFGEAADALAPGAVRLTLMEAEGTVLRPMRAAALFAGAGDAETPDEHVWLDPRNAALWVGLIAVALAGADPGRAALYRANAAAARVELAALEAELDAVLDPVRARGFFVFHDAYRYFEDRFGLAAEGAVSMGDARAPGASRLGALRERLREGEAVCLFTEPQFAPRLAEMLVEGTEVRVGVLDPLGAELTPGPELYPTLLRNLAASLRECLDDR